MDQLKVVFETLNNVNVKNIKTVDFEGTSPFYDYFVIATASPTQSNAFLGYLKEKFQTLKSEGNGSGWLIVDLGDIVVHLFTEEERKYFNLDNHLLGFKTLTDYSSNE